METTTILDRDAIIRGITESAERYQITGTSVAVAQDNELVETATGFVNTDAGIEATTDSVFQIGSITKLFTATLIMQLVDDGLIQLDTPLSVALPELDLANSATAKTITVSHLLSHTSGIEGDHFIDTGVGDDCVERFVISCSALGQIHRPGEFFSYCNTGFVLLGRIIERLRGGFWHQVLQKQIIQPLELSAMGTEPHHAILYRAAVGHMDAGTEPGKSSGGSPGDESTPHATVIPRWNLPRSNGPAGSTTFGRARDLIPFAQAHLGGGVGPNGHRMLSTASVKAMTKQQIQLPHYSMASGWGLGWMLFDQAGGQLIGHNGATLGQSSCLRIEPESGTILSILTTGGGTRVAAFFKEVTDQIFGEYCGTTSPPAADEQATLTLSPSGLDRYCGHYRRLALEFTVTRNGDHLELVARGLKSPFSEAPEQHSVLYPVSKHAFVLETPGPLAASPVLFEDFDQDDQPLFIGVGARLTARVP